MNIILYAHAGSGNHGCEALVRSTVCLLGDTPVLYTSGYDEDISCGLRDIVRLHKDINSLVPRKSVAYALAAIQTKLTGETMLFTQLIKKKFLSHVQKDAICLSIGGDNYCYAGTEILGDLNALLKKKGVKTVLWGCSIDPEVITPRMVKDLKKYDLITVRESLTQEALTRAGVISNVRRVADPAFLLEMQESQLPRGFSLGNTIGLNISPLILEYTEKKEEALSSFYALVQHILDTTDSVIALIPHVVKSGNSDFEVLEPIFKKFEGTGRVVLIPDQSCMQLKYIISQCRLFIGARTHATIAAYSTEVPTLVIGYSVKSRGIAKDLFGSDDKYVCPIQSISVDDDLISSYDWLEENAMKIKMKLHDIIPEYKERARLGKTYIEELANK